MEGAAMTCRLLLFVIIASFSFVLNAEEKVFTLTSPDFREKGRLPAKFATKNVRGGSNVSPALAWKNVPKGTKCFVLTCIDTNPIARNWVHWMVLDIPSDVTALKENMANGRMPNGSRQLDNSYGSNGYGGPQPPKKTGSHTYVFTLYALNVPVLKTRESFLSEKNLKKLLKGKVIKKARLTAQFSQ